MPPTEPDLLAALRKHSSLEEICHASSTALPDAIAARDAAIRRSAAPRDQTIAAAVASPVEIKRDRAGVPHVFADSTEDLFFGLGVAMAQDRIWQMDRLRRRALGRQAEILGPDYVASDSAHLTVGIDRISAADAEAMDDRTRTLVSAFVAGINGYIETTGPDLPFEFRLLDYTPAPFTVTDIVAIGRDIWWSLNGRIDRLAAAEAARLLPTEKLRQLYLTPEASENLVVPWAGRGSGNGHAAGTDDATGSNNWAINGKRSGTGHPILCGDPHQPFWIPSTWYEFALHGPEDHAAGAGHTGLPGMWWGSNGTVAWSITNNMASTRDLYQEQLHPTDPHHYRDGDTWRAFDERTVTIPVRGEAERTLTIRSTTRGPVVNALITPVTEGGDPPLSLRWVGAEHMNDLRATIAISRSRDWASFRNALRDWSVAVFNWVYADDRGDIGYQMAGRLPIRGRVVYGFREANNPADQWQGYIPFDELPNAYNPARGYVASANQRIVPPDFEYPIYGAYSQGHRGVRIDEAFAEQPVMDRAANIRFQNDVKNTRGDRLCPPILRLLRGNTDPDVAIVADALTGWDYRYDLASTAPTVFETFMALWQRAVLSRHLPERLFDLTVQQTGLATSLLEDGDETYFPAGLAATAATVARQSTAALRERLGANPAAWRWERVHTAHWRHPVSTPALADALDIGPAPVDGGSHTIRNTGGELPPHSASSGAEYRIVVDFAAPDSFLAVQNIGNSGDPGSPHYKDQFEPWLRGEYHVVHLRRDRIEAVCEATTHLTPRRQ
jgi:penicillin amidase